MAEGLFVKGGGSADSLAVLEAPYEERCPYMTEKPLPQTSFVWTWLGDTPAGTLKLAWPDGTVDEIPMDIDVNMAAGKKDYGLYYAGYLTYHKAGQESVAIFTVYTEIGCNQTIS